MNWIAPLLCLCFPLSLIGQSKTTIDLIFGLENSFRHFSNSSIKEGRFSSNPEDGRYAEDLPSLGYRFGLNVNRRLGTKYFYLKTGLRYSYNNYVTKLSGLRWATEFDPITGMFVDDPNITNTIEVPWSNSFVEIPLILRKELSDNKIQPFFELGISSLLHWSKLGLSNNNNGPNDLRTLHLLGSISFGLNYEMNESIKLFLQSIFRYHLTHLGDKAYSEHLYNYGAEIGLRKAI